MISSNFDYPQLVENNYIGFISQGIQISGSKPVIKNNIFYNKQNGFNYGHAIFEMSLSPNTVKVFNNIAITFNYSQFILTTTTRPYQVINNVIMGNYYQGFCIVPQNILINNLAIGGYIGFKFFPDYGPPIKIAYNNGYRNQANYDGFTPDSTNLSVDPMIVSEDSIQDFHLQMFSRMIDKGDPSIIDLDGTRSDIGAYGGPYGESYEYLDYPPKTPLIYYAIKQSDGIRLGWKVSTETDFHSYLIYRDTTTDFTADSTKLIAELNNTIYLDTLPISSNKLYYKMRSKDNQGKISNASKEIAIIINNVTGEKDITPITEYELYQNYPNPFNPGTIIPYRLKERGYVKLMVYDIKGELVSVLVNQEQEPGYYEAEFRAEHKTSGDWIEKIASGIYLYTIEVKNGSNIPIYNEMKKMLLVK